MSFFVLPGGRAAYAAALTDLDAASGLNASLLELDGTLTDTAVKAITGCTNATPGVITSNSHGFANGDIVLVRGVVGSIGMNQLAKVANQTANTFTLQTLGSEALDVAAGGVYTSGGVALNLTKALNRADVDGAQISTPYVIPTTTVALGVVKPSADLLWSSVADLGGGKQVHGYIVCKASGAAATDTGIFWYDGRVKVTVNTTVATSATAIPVEPLAAPIASGATIVFSNGVTATLTAGAAKGARTLAVSALASGIALGHEGEAAINTGGQNFPVTPNNGSITHSIDAVEGLFTA
jgi:hypothetical protein